MKPTKAKPDSAERDVVLTVFPGIIALIAAVAVVVFIADLVGLIRILDEGSVLRW